MSKPLSLLLLLLAFCLPTQAQNDPTDNFIAVRIRLVNPFTGERVDQAKFRVLTPQPKDKNGKEIFLRRGYPYDDTHLWFWCDRRVKYYDLHLRYGYELDVEITPLRNASSYERGGATFTKTEEDKRFKPYTLHVDLRDSTGMERDPRFGNFRVYELPDYTFEPTRRITIRGYGVDGMSERETDGIKMEIYTPDTVLVSNNSQSQYVDGRHVADVNIPYIPGQYLAKIISLKKREINANRYALDVDPAYEPEWLDFDISVIPDDLKTVTLPTAYFHRPGRRKALNEVTVTASKVMFYHKGDTLVYNADAFVLAEGSSLDALISQLPGVSMNSNGVIYCNGKRVDNLLLNGKDLFNGNHKLMLQNLPYYTVKDIAVYDKTGHDSELMGMKIRGDMQYVMDVRLKRQYSMGWIVNAEAGAGTHERYLAKLFAMWFSDNASIIAHASANNLSDTENPGQKDGAWSRDRMADGVITRQSGGLTYTAQGHASKWELKGSADVEHRITDTRATTTQTNFLPGGDTYRYRWSTDRDEMLKVNTNHTFFFKLGTRANLTVRPGFTFDKTEQTGASTDASFKSEVADITRRRIENLYTDYDPVAELLLNSRLSELLTNGRRFNGTLSARTTIRTKSTGQKNSLTLGASAGYVNNHRDRFNRYLLNYGAEGADGTFRSQYFKGHPSDDRRFGANVQFTQYFDWRKSSLPINYEFSHLEQKRTSALYYLNDAADFDAASAPLGMLPSQSQYLSTIDAAQSYDSRLVDNRHSLLVQFNPTVVIPLAKRPDAFSFGFQVYLKFNLADRSYDYRRVEGEPIALHRTSSALDYRAVLTLANWGAQRNKTFISLSATGRSDFAPMSDLVSVVNNTDPLNISLGNPNLSNPYTHSFNFNGSITNGQTKNSLNVTASLLTNQIGRSVVYDHTTGVRTIQPRNVSGNMMANASYEFFTRFGRLKAFDITAKTYGDYTRSVDFTGTTASEPARRVVNNLALGEKLRLNWTLGKHRVSAFGDVRVNRYRSADPGFANFSSMHSNCGLSALLNLPQNWSVGTDLSLYTRRGYADDALNTSDLIWNLRLSKSILKGSLMFVLDGYDLLHQISPVSYTVNAQARTETLRNAIPSYLLFHIQYRFSQSPKR